MRETPLVSVVITAYNRADLLPRAVGSVLSQTFSDFELIVVDDGSREDIAGALRSFHDPRLRLIRHDKNRGIGAARNTGIAEAKGVWIASLDSDDAWLPDYLARQMARLDADPSAGVVACLCERRGAAGSAIAPRSPLPDGDDDPIDAMLAYRRVATPSAYIIRRTAIESVGGYDTQQAAADDFDLLLKLARAGQRFVAVQEPLVIKYEDASDHVSGDPVARLAGTIRLQHAWEALTRERLGQRDSRRWWKRRWRWVARAHEAYIETLIATGDRRAALRYAIRMRGHARWGRGYMLRAVTFALLGRSVYAKVGLARAPSAWQARDSS